MGEGRLLAKHTCSASRFTFEPAAKATSLNLSGNSAMMSSVWVPIEPVEPRTEKRCNEEGNDERLQASIDQMEMRHHHRTVLTGSLSKTASHHSQVSELPTAFMPHCRPRASNEFQRTAIVLTHLWLAAVLYLRRHNASRPRWRGRHALLRIDYHPSPARA